MLKPNHLKDQWAEGNKIMNVLTVKWKVLISRNKISCTRLTALLKNLKFFDDFTIICDLIQDITVLYIGLSPYRGHYTMESDTEWEVEQILERGRFNNVTYYLVKWLGYSREEATWEPITNL